ncbi:MAG: hypothetical protein V3U30_01665, partial [Thermoplasmata archaeon]
RVLASSTVADMVPPSSLFPNGFEVIAVVLDASLDLEHDSQVWDLRRAHRRSPPAHPFPMVRALP